jgi:hypothetical protein
MYKIALELNFLEGEFSSSAIKELRSKLEERTAHVEYLLREAAGSVCWLALQVHFELKISKVS